MAKKDCGKTIARDVAIIGGGAAGAHAAVRLREDFGKSVVVVEKQNRLVRPTIASVNANSAHSFLLRNIARTDQVWLTDSLRAVM